MEYNKQQKIKNWLETGDTGMGVDTTIRGAIRDYLYERQENKCAICGITNQWNGAQLNFVLDHIDGDASNSTPDNVRLVCPNCDSQLPTFKSRNPVSKRTGRKEYLHSLKAE
jgi:5-methylcytosine-specific restriction endonuclease McrA